MTFRLALVCDECQMFEYITPLQGLPDDWIEDGNHHFCGAACRLRHGGTHAKILLDLGGGTMENHIHDAQTAVDPEELQSVRNAAAAEEMAYLDALQRGYARDRR